MSTLTERKIVLTLASLSAITPLAIDTYLPAIPTISKDFLTTIPNIEFSVSIYFFGMALGQLFGGPISDAYGRRPMIFAGLFLFGICSLLLAFVTQIELFWLLRALQAFSGGLATVNVSATVRDMFSGKESARVFSLISMVMLMAPLIAPSIGSVILAFFDWNLIFIFISLYAFISLFHYLKTFPKVKKEKTKATPLKNYIEVFNHKQALVFIFAQVLCTSGMYTYITSSSFIYMEYFSINSGLFSILFGVTVLMMMVFGRLNAWLVKTKEPISLLKFGMLSQTLLGFILFVFHNDAGIYLIFPLIGLYIGMLGFIFSNSVALTLEFFPHISASANAIIGVLQYSIGALMGFVASSLHDGTLFPIFSVMAIVSICGTSLLFFGTKNYKSPHHH